VYDTGFLLMFPLLFLSEQAVSELIFAFGLLRSVGDCEGPLATRDVVSKDIGCDVSFLLRLSQAAELGQKLGCILAARPRDWPAPKSAAEISGLSRGLEPGCDGWLR
jgi:hypothetical protein